MAEGAPAMAQFSRRAALGLGASLLAAPALGQGRFPNRPIRFITPWPPGGSLDVLQRSMFEVVRKDLGQPILSENLPGARGTRAATFLVTQGVPDGYTLAHHHLSVLRHPFLTKQPSWDPVNDFSYIMQFSGFTFGTVVRNDSPYQRLADVFAEARRKPGELTYSTSGIATTNHIAMEDLLRREKAEMTHVPYRGSGPAATDLIAGRVDVFFDNLPSILPHIRAGTVRALAALSAERIPELPDLPTFAEQGVQGMVIDSWFGFMTPARTPPAAIAALNAAFNKAMETPAVRQRMQELALTPIGGTPAQMGAHIQSEVARWSEVVRRQGIRAE